MVSKHSASVVLAALMAIGAVACTSTSSDRGPVESTSANAGRAVDDSVITGKVKAALVADPATKAHQISVETFKGTVQLNGFVDDTTARKRAAEIASNVDGVKDVQNNLELRDQG
jgi:osmotically-inducible protein OsmY